MATKALTNSDDRPKMPGFVGKIVDTWQDFAHFLTDVRGEMRKVVTPSRNEVKSTTTVVIIAVFLFGLYFFVVDWAFQFGLTSLLTKLGGLQK